MTNQNRQKKTGATERLQNACMALIEDEIKKKRASQAFEGRFCCLRRAV
jgi:hypothetical protein